MISRSSRVTGVGPDLSVEEFTAILQVNDSPALAEASRMYSRVVGRQVSPAFFLAIFMHESNMGKEGVCFNHKTKSPGNTRTTRTGKGYPIYAPERDSWYMSYLTWENGADDAAYRLVDPKFAYSDKSTIEQILPVWAPASDSNDPEVYIASVVDYMNGIIKMADQPNIVWKGCPNFWAGRDGNVAVAIVDHIMQGTMESTDGWFKNPSSEVSAHFGVAKDGRIWQWVKVEDSAWANGIEENQDGLVWIKAADATKENLNRLTISIEHEGNTGEAMPEAQYQATLALHKWLCSTYKIPTNREYIIGHYQIAHLSRPNCPGTGFPWDRLMVDLNPQPVVAPSVVWVPQTKVSIGGGFKRLWDSLGLPILGYPVTNEFDIVFKGDTKLRTVQLFERGGLVYEKENAAPWDVHPMLVAQLAEAEAYAVANKILPEQPFSSTWKDNIIVNLTKWLEAIDSTLFTYAKNGITVEQLKAVYQMVQDARSGKAYS